MSSHSEIWRQEVMQIFIKISQENQVFIANLYALKIESVGSSESLINFYRTTRSHIWKCYMLSNTVFLAKLRETELSSICNGGRLSSNQKVLRGASVITTAVSSQLLQQIYNNELITETECRHAARQLGNLYYCILIAWMTFRLSIWI
jgi:hypothetical protein